MRGLTLLLGIMITLARPALADESPVRTSHGDLYVAQVLSTTEQLRSITAKLRQQTLLGDKQLVGSGQYWQQQQGGGNAPRRVSRWEMQTQVGEDNASFVQVNDGIHLWTDRRLPSHRQINRLDVTWLQDKLHATRRGVAQSDIDRLITAVEGQGGLGQMLGDLLRNFTFTSPQPTQLNGLPVNAVIGTWRPRRLAQLWPAGSRTDEDDPPTWPRQLPHHVLLLVGRNQFPYVCEYRTTDDAPLATSLAGLRPCSEPLLRYEIFDLRLAVAIPAEMFVYSPGELDWTDETSLVLEQLTKGQPKATTSGVASPTFR